MYLLNINNTDIFVYFCLDDRIAWNGRRRRRRGRRTGITERREFIFLPFAILIRQSVQVEGRTRIQMAFSVILLHFLTDVLLGSSLATFLLLCRKVDYLSVTVAKTATS